MFIQLTDPNTKAAVYVAVDAVTLISAGHADGSRIEFRTGWRSIEVAESPTQVLAAIAGRNRGPYIRREDLPRDI